MPSKKPNAVDVSVGKNIRFRRLERGMSQTSLANQLGVSFQQLQKYEKGTNRVGASRLMQIAHALKVPVTAFFEGVSEAPVDHDAALRSPAALLATPHALRLAQAFAQIPDANLRLSVVTLVEKIASSDAVITTSKRGRRS